MPDPHGTSQYNFVLFETLFRAKGLRATLENRNLTSVFDDRASFRAKTFFAPDAFENRNFPDFLTIEPPQ